MLYILLTMELPRNKVNEAWTIYQEKLLKWDKECVERFGGKYIGYFNTEYGMTGEISFLVAYPSLEAREKVVELYEQYKDEMIKKASEEFRTYTPKATVKVMRPLPMSPLQ